MYADGMMKLVLSELEMYAAQLGEECAVPDLLGEDVIQNKLKFDLSEDDEIYEGYGRLENAYPYRQFNQYSGELKLQKVKMAVLENQYLKATFLPEFGGRLWSLIDKITGKNLLYTNDVLQFRNLAVRNAWFSGGVEWNVGIIGHTPFTTAPLYTAEIKNDKGNAVLRMYEYERIRKICYQMDFWLDEGDRFLNCRMRLVNDHDTVVPMYWWSNTAVPEFDGGKIMVPAKKAYTLSDGNVTKVDIPYVGGIDIRQYNDIPNPVDYFFEIDEDNPKYIENVDRDGFGLLQISTKRLRSRKLFTWGHNRASKHWQGYLTKDGGDYIEIQAGLAKTQYGCIPMAPHTAWEWMEQYGPAILSENEIKEKTAALEQKLKDTKMMAKSKGKLLMTGSGYGAFAEHTYASHLEFVIEKDTLEHWKKFIHGGSLPVPNPQNKPDEFPQTEEIVRLLQETVHTVNRDNWYAHYQLGVRYCADKKYAEAENELKTSYCLCPNAWSCHALACVYYMCKDNGEAITWIEKGVALEYRDISYLKEMFKLLYLCGGYDKILRGFENLEKDKQENSRLKLYYISAKHALGQEKEAFVLLEENGGLDIEDIREGECSVQQLWEELNRAVTGEEREIPYRYLFR